MKVAIIFLGGSNMQNRCFWPSYVKCSASYPHDLIFVHRNWEGVNKTWLNTNIPNNIFIENKIDKNGYDVPHGAFGGYKKYFYKYRSSYDLFIFISDDVIVRRDNWLSYIVSLFESHDKLGFGATQIFHSQPTNYPSHMRAPFWVAKADVLNCIDWKFNSDHDGELSIGEQLSKTDYFGVQIGNKLDFAYDSLDNDSTHIVCELEKKFFYNKKFIGKFYKNEYDIFRKKLKYLNINKCTIESSLAHVTPQNYITDIEPFDRLVYKPSLSTALKYTNNRIFEIYKGIFTYDM